MLSMTPTPMAAPSRLEISRSRTAPEPALSGQDTALYGLRCLKRQIREGTVTLEVRQATADDLPVILRLIDDAKAWLKTKGTNQWSEDWADEDGRGRSARVGYSLKEGTTFLATVPNQGGELAVATVTIEKKPHLHVWPAEEETSEGLAYLSRLVTAREFSGLRIGAALLDWACAFAKREYGAKLIRIDVWTDNYALHRYYEDLDFEFRGLCPDENYPSRALFQRATEIYKGIGPSVLELSEFSPGPHWI
jgi:ribosomal protein S18 acetylase RimI-like enzyme